MVKKCPNCGASNVDEAPFCIRCGNNLALPRGAAAKPRVKVVKPLGRTPASTSSTAFRPSRIPSSEMCFYHPQIPASYICRKCGRSICSNCLERRGDIDVCVHCAASMPRTSSAPEIGSVPGFHSTPRVSSVREGTSARTAKRPAAVTAIATFALIMSLILFISGTIYVIEGIDDYEEEIFFLGLITAVIGILYVPIGIGLFKGKNWARIAFLVLCVLQILTIYPVIFIWYLTRPHVKKLFGVV